MAFTGYSLPYDVVLAKCNKVEITLTTDRRPFEFSQKLLQFTFTASPAVDDTIGFTYGDITVLFTVKNPADDSGTQFSTNAGALPLTDYLDLVADEIAANFDVINNFEVTRVSTNRIILLPRFGYDHDFTIDDNLTNCTVIQTEQTNANYEPNLLIFLGVETYNPFIAKWAPPLWHVLTPDVSGAATFEIHKDFDLFFEAPRTQDIGSSTFHSATTYDNRKKFRLKYAEYYGEPAAVREIILNSQIFMALYGGKPYNGQPSSWWQVFQANDKFLSLQSTTKRISYNQPEWIYWIGKQDPSTTVEVVSQATFADGTVDSEVVQASTYVVNYQDTRKFTAQYKQLGYTLNPANPISSYQVWLREYGGAQISEKMTYIIDNVVPEYEKYFLVGNSLSTYDVVRGTGKVLKEIKYQSQLASVPDTNENVHDYAEYFQYNKKQITTFQGSIGYRDKEYIEYLKEMMLSDGVRLIDMENQRFIHVLILSESVEFYKDDDDIFQLEFEYRYAFDDCANDEA